MFKRRNYFIEKTLQTEIILAFLFLTLFLFVVTFLNVYIFSFHIMKDVLEPAEYIQLHLIVKKAFSMLGSRIIFLAVADILILIVVALFISHQIGGPSYKIRKSIDKIRDGNLKFRVSLREGDKFSDLAEHVNSLIDVYAEDVNSLKESSEKLRAAVMVKDDKAVIDELEIIQKRLDRYNV